MESRSWFGAKSARSIIRWWERGIPGVGPGKRSDTNVEFTESSVNHRRY